MLSTKLSACLTIRGREDFVVFFFGSYIYFLDIVRVDNILKLILTKIFIIKYCYYY